MLDWQNLYVHVEWHVVFLYVYYTFIMTIDFLNNNFTYEWHEISVFLLPVIFTFFSKFDQKIDKNK